MASYTTVVAFSTSHRWVCGDIAQSQEKANMEDPGDKGGSGAQRRKGPRDADGLVQRDLELVERYRDEVVDVDAPRAQLGHDVWWYELADQVGTNAQLCWHASVDMNGRQGRKMTDLRA